MTHAAAKAFSWRRRWPSVSEVGCGGLRSSIWVSSRAKSALHHISHLLVPRKCQLLLKEKPLAPHCGARRLEGKPPYTYIFSKPTNCNFPPGAAKKGAFLQRTLCFIQLCPGWACGTGGGDGDGGFCSFLPLPQLPAAGREFPASLPAFSWAAWASAAPAWAVPA